MVVWQCRNRTGTRYVTHEKYQPSLAIDSVIVLLRVGTTNSFVRHYGEFTRPISAVRGAIGAAQGDALQCKTLMHADVLVAARSPRAEVLLTEDPTG